MSDQTSHSFTPDAIPRKTHAGAHAVAVRDSNHLQELTTSTFTTWPEVGRLRTGVAFSYRQRHALPDVSESH